MVAYCQACGEKKVEALSRCVGCGHCPRSSEDETVKAVYLSTGRFQNPKRSADYESELAFLARSIRNGVEVDYDSDDLDRLGQEKRLVESVPPSAPWIALVRLFLPGLLFVAILFGIAWLLRAGTD